VQGFDRLDRNVKGPENTGDYLARFGEAIRRDARSSLGFDAASNEAVQQLAVLLPGYDAVLWSLGEESTADETFNATEQALVTGYLNGGGSLLVSGAEVGWDLDAQGTASDRAFYRNVLGATYVADDANVYTLQPGLAGTVSAGLPASSFDNGSAGSYDVNYADVLAPTTAQGVVCLRYGNGLAAGVQTSDPVTGARVVTLGVPLETITTASPRATLLQGCLDYLLAARPLRAPATATIGAATGMTMNLPGEAGRGYFVLCSLGTSPGTLLPGGGLLPLNVDVLLQLSLDPASPVFVGCQGVLPASGQVAPTLVVPPLPWLAGWQLFFAGFTLDASGTQERQLTNWVRVTLTN